MPTIAQLLVELAREPELLASFQGDPRAFMEQRGLSEGQQAIVLSGDLDWIRKAIDYEYATGATEVLPSFGEEGEVAMMVTWRPLWAPTWIKPPPESH